MTKRGKNPEQSRTVRHLDVTEIRVAIVGDEETVAALQVAIKGVLESSAFQQLPWSVTTVFSDDFNDEYADLLVQTRLEQVSTPRLRRPNRPLSGSN